MASITFDDDDKEVAILTFSVDYDQACLDFDGTDSVEFNDQLESNFLTQVLFDSGDTEAEIDFTIYGLGISMSDGVIVEITFTVSDEEECSGATAEVGFASGTAFGNYTTGSVSGWTQDGSVKIAAGQSESAAGHTGEGFAARSLEAIRPPRPLGPFPRPA